ncbi:unnamed protein product [Acanthoscelides obtectus]|uniref:Zinc finger PHD-type domain-containing protein n=1 Tax=Acanthoscelides obtectus TaxID=200917 RepID=A0A9P0Q9E7_ACAOB|nr:unnamed protein product [Acanthoscelides obtectus]CAK1688354.1 hypothetical protein AOBTE_LOCUS36696 [Acanthoscelides obtectus]
MASNADSCDSCKDNFVVNSKYIECSICEGRYHTVCVSVKDSWLKLFSDWVNFSWSCDKCILKSQSREQQLASEIAALKKEIEFLTHEKNLSSKMIEQLEYTNNLQKSVIDSHQQQAAHSTMNSVMLPSRSTASSTLSFSDTVKKIPNRSSVLLIKSDSNSGNNDILRDVTTSVNPAKINVCINNTHKIRNGIAVHCQDEKNEPLEERQQHDEEPISDYDDSDADPNYEPSVSPRRKKIKFSDFDDVSLAPLKNRQPLKKVNENVNANCRVSQERPDKQEKHPLLLSCHNNCRQRCSSKAMMRSLEN